jgi:hypothetical protein
MAYKLFNAAQTAGAPHLVAHPPAAQRPKPGLAVEVTRLNASEVAPARTRTRDPSRASARGFR